MSLFPLIEIEMGLSHKIKGDEDCKERVRESLDNINKKMFTIFKKCYNQVRPWEIASPKRFKILCPNNHTNSKFVFYYFWKLIILVLLTKSFHKSFKYLCPNIFCAPMHFNSFFLLFNEKRKNMPLTTTSKCQTSHILTNNHLT